MMDFTTGPARAPSEPFPFRHRTMAQVRAEQGSAHLAERQRELQILVDAEKQYQAWVRQGMSHRDMMAVYGIGVAVGSVIQKAVVLQIIRRQSGGAA